MSTIPTDINWSSLPFGYLKTDYNIRAYYRDGRWSKFEKSTDETIPVHIAATALHYGQSCFEGLKAFRCRDGKIRLFRPEENAKRLILSANGIMMQPVPKEIFIEACKEVVLINEKYVPPFMSGASFYLRPILYGSGGEVGVKPSKEYTFMVFGGPVGPYFKTGFKPMPMQLIKDFDRAAPLGTGMFKVGGNYAASLRASERAHGEGFNTVLFTDAKDHKFIDEAGPANFFAIKGNRYITPDSHSILRSITNMTLQQIALDLGMEVERRHIAIDELAEFEEIGACGTAAVITPVSRMVNRSNNNEYIYTMGGEAGPKTQKLYDILTGIQSGIIEDKYGWMVEV
ncbi:MAG: branched-chain amino acid aminotransferase [Bacteroidales bacterium]|jgi:branched-chain amino acid aminotransferase|nr:branched-chain amino acid aminotransferase [Bacteroidales bacterium]